MSAISPSPFRKARRAFFTLGLASAAFCQARLVLAVEEVSITEAPIHENHPVVTFSSSVRATQGNFDAYGNYQPYPDGSEAISVSSNLSVNYRFSKDWEGDVGIPFTRNVMDFPTGSTSSYSVGGLLMGARYHLGGWAHLIAHVSGVLPWQFRSSSMTGDPGASLPDSMGDGGTASGASMHVGIGGGRTFGRFRTTADASVILPFAVSQVAGDAPPGTPPDTVLSGKRYAISEGASYLLSPKWSIDAILRESWSGSTTLNGTAIPGTLSRAYGTSLGGMYTPNQTWRLAATYDTAYPFYNYAVNLPYSPSLSLTMIYTGN